LLEDLEDLSVVAERADEPSVPLEKVIAKLKKDGLLQDCLSLDPKLHLETRGKACGCGHPEPAKIRIKTIARQADYAS
jgi:hypothetical protein